MKAGGASLGLNIYFSVSKLKLIRWSEDPGGQQFTVAEQKIPSGVDDERGRGGECVIWCLLLLIHEVFIPLTLKYFLFQWCFLCWDKWALLCVKLWGSDCNCVYLCALCSGVCDSVAFHRNRVRKIRLREESRPNWMEWWRLVERKRGGRWSRLLWEKHSLNKVQPAVSVTHLQTSLYSRHVPPGELQVPAENASV